MNISDNMCMADLLKDPGLKEVKEQLHYGSGIIWWLLGHQKIKGLRQQGWNVDSMGIGLERTARAAATGSCLHPVYDPSEWCGDRQRKRLGYLEMAADQPEDKPFIVLCSGGAYAFVCNLIEGLPVAAAFNELGYDCYVVNYHAGERNILPKALDDLGTAVKKIIASRKAAGKNSDYIVGGFSAGGHLVTLFGTENKGYQNYGLPKPKAMFALYPVISSRFFAESPQLKICPRYMYPKNPTAELIREYDVDEHVGSGFPPCFIACGKDDSMVTPKNSKALKALLDAQGIPAILEEGDHAPHGFGDGKGTSLEGWILRAAAFVESLE